MNLWKTNKILWYFLGLSLVLLAAAMVISTGTAFARYRQEREAEITMEVKPATQIGLGVLREPTEEEVENAGGKKDLVFDSSVIPRWEINGDTCLLRLAIANGVSESEFYKSDVKVTLRLIATLGLWEGEKAADIYLRLPSETSASGYEEVLAAVSAIEAGTALHTTHGDGWVYEFRNGEEEQSWILTGGEFSCVEVVLVMKNAAPGNASLLQPLVYGEAVAD